jgi:hypothetical protein
MWGNNVTIHSVFFKKTTKQNSQSAQYEKKKMPDAAGLWHACALSWVNL